VHGADAFEPSESVALVAAERPDAVPELLLVG